VTATWGVRPEPHALAEVSRPEVSRPHVSARQARVRAVTDRVWAGAYRPPAEAVAGALLDWAGDPFPATRTLE